MSVTKTSRCITMVTQALEQHSIQINENSALQDFNLKVKFKRGWPFRIVVTMNYCHDQGE